MRLVRAAAGIGIILLLGCERPTSESAEKKLIGYHAKMPPSWLKTHLEIHNHRTDELGLVLVGCGRPKRNNLGCEHGVDVVSYHPVATDPPRVTEPSIVSTGWEIIKAHGEPHVEATFAYIYKDARGIRSEKETVIVPVREFEKAPSYERIRRMWKLNDDPPPH